MRGLTAFLGLLALAMHVLAPPGFMVAAGRDGPAIVICTGHGPATLADLGHGPGHGSDKAGHEQACSFAGHGLAAAPPLASSLSHAAYPPAPPASRAIADLSPGRGLAAPPPPSQGPPLLS